MKITQKQLRRIIKEVTNRNSLPIEDNDAIYDAIEQIEHELYKEFNILNHDDAIARIRSVIEDEYRKAAEKAHVSNLRHGPIS